MDNDHGITGELREWAQSDALRAGMSLRTARDQALAIADRIDAALAERYVELPKDADGEYIHVGDELRDAWWHEQNQGEVQRLMLDRDGWWLMLKNSSERFYVHEFHEWHHCYHKPLTVEDVLCELLDKVDDDRAGQAEIIAEYAKRLRLTGDAE